MDCLCLKKAAIFAQLAPKQRELNALYVDVVY